MTWNFQNDQPIYAQLVEEITARIVAGVYQPGERMPSVRDLAAEAGVNPNTMQRAMGQLEAQGLMFSQRTAGRFVTEDKNMIENAKQGLAKAQIRQFLRAMTNLGYSLPEIVTLLKEGGENEEKPRKEGMTNVGNPQLQSPS